MPQLCMGVGVLRANDVERWLARGVGSTPQLQLRLGWCLTSLSDKVGMPWALCRDAISMFMSVVVSARMSVLVIMLVSTMKSILMSMLASILMSCY